MSPTATITHVLSLSATNGMTICDSTRVSSTLTRFAQTDVFLRKIKLLQSLNNRYLFLSFPSLVASFKRQHTSPRRVLFGGMSSFPLIVMKLVRQAQRSLSKFVYYFKCASAYCYSETNKCNSSTMLLE